MDMNRGMIRYLRAHVFDAEGNSSVSQQSISDAEKVAQKAQDDLAAAKAAEKAAAEAARKSIKVESYSKEDDDKEKEKEQDDDEDEDEPEDDEDENDDEEDDEEDADNIRKKPTAAEIAAEQAAEKEARRAARVEKRINKLTAQAKAAEDEVARLRAQLAEKPVEGLTEEEVDRRATDKALSLAKQKEIEAQQNAFDAKGDELSKAATKIDKDFNRKINAAAEECGLMPREMIEYLSDLDNKNGGDVIAHIANDVDLYDEIISLTPRKLAVRLEKLSEELKAKPKATRTNGKPPRERPSAPPPSEPIPEGNTHRGNTLPKTPTQNMDEYARIRALQVEARNKARGYR